MTFSNVKVGDKVWSFTNGFGIVSIVETCTYPITVDFDNGEMDSFTLQGLLNEDDINPLLFWDEVVFEVPEKPLPKLEVDAKVVVWNHGQKHNMHFSHFAEVRGIVRMFTFDSGKTSFTTQETSSWGSYEVME